MRRLSIAQTTDAIPSAADIKRHALGIVEVRSTYVGLCISWVDRQADEALE
jgi:hypothetical protein